jgi:DNA-binding protein HU-beta
MADRIQKNELVKCLAARMATDEITAAAYFDATFEILYAAIKAGESVTVPNFGRFYVRPERDSWVFRFNPSQKLRALFGWSSTYKGER